jgi:hypothetical protein
MSLAKLIVSIGMLALFSKNIVKLLWEVKKSVKFVLTRVSKQKKIEEWKYSYAAVLLER